MDNSFYLKDFKNNSKLKENNVDIDVYSDDKEKLNLDIVLKNGNIYIKSKNQEKIEIVDDNSSIEFIDDHYKKINKSDIDKYEFKFTDIINKNIKKKYSSILNPFTLLINGFKKVFDYSVLKKILLIGFIISGAFIMYAVSSICATLTYKDENFVTYNKNYLTIEQKKLNLDDYGTYENNPLVNYILPGNSIINLKLKLNDYYQTTNTTAFIKGSLSDINMIDDKDLILGTMPSNNHEIVIDSLALKRAINNSEEMQMVGIKDINQILDRYVSIDNMGEYKIVGITNLDSPSIYTSSSDFINILYNSKNNNDNYIGESTTGIIDYDLYKEKIELKEGKYPTEDYEIIVNIDNKDSMKLDKEIDQKINDRKLKVVGYYFSSDGYDFYLTNTSTIKYSLILSSKNMTIYAKDKESAIDEFRNYNLNIKDSYDLSKSEYKESLKEQNKNTLIVSSIMIIISLIEMYLMSRSSFLSRIKEIGTYRAIGVKKKDIYKMFYGEIFAITTIASLPGILFMAYCLSMISKIKYLSNAFVINPLIVILSILIVYLFNLLVGLIPVFNVIRKTPASILSRTDAE